MIVFLGSSFSRKLEKVLPSSSQLDVKLKHLTGEWFYEAKSRRHNDKIHGSEIILAAMKQGKAASLGVLVFINVFLILENKICLGH